MWIGLNSVVIRSPLPYWRFAPQRKHPRKPPRVFVLFRKPKIVRQSSIVNFICKRISGGRFARRVSRNATPLFAAKDVALNELAELTSRNATPGVSPGGGGDDKTSPPNQGSGF